MNLLMPLVQTVIGPLLVSVPLAQLVSPPFDRDLEANACYWYTVLLHALASFSSTCGTAAETESLNASPPVSSPPRLQHIPQRAFGRFGRVDLQSI